MAAAVVVCFGYFRTPRHAARASHAHDDTAAGRRQYLTRTRAYGGLVPCHIQLGCAYLLLVVVLHAADGGGLSEGQVRLLNVTSICHATKVPPPGHTSPHTGQQHRGVCPQLRRGAHQR